MSCSFVLSVVLQSAQPSDIALGRWSTLVSLYTAGKVRSLFGDLIGAPTEPPPGPLA